MSDYIFFLRHDEGTVSIRVCGYPNIESARRAVLAAEHAPPSAIIAEKEER